MWIWHWCFLLSKLVLYSAWRTRRLTFACCLVWSTRCLDNIPTFLDIRSSGLVSGQRLSKICIIAQECRMTYFMDFVSTLEYSNSRSQLNIRVPCMLIGRKLFWVNNYNILIFRSQLNVTSSLFFVINCIMPLHFHNDIFHFQLTLL